MNPMDDREDYNNRSAVHDAMAHFTYHWAPSQPRKAAEFHADLLRLIQAVHRDSAKPMEAALKNAFATFPISPLLHPKPAEPMVALASELAEIVTLLAKACDKNPDEWDYTIVGEAHERAIVAAAKLRGELR